jgi:hypothetical protein
MPFLALISGSTSCAVKLGRFANEKEKEKKANV